MSELKILTELPRDQWSEFVNEHPKGNIFQTPEMFDVYMTAENNDPVLIAILNEDDKVSGILLAVIQKQYPGFLGNFTARSIIWGGPLVRDNDKKIYELIIKEYGKLIKGKAIYSQFRNLWEQGNEKYIFKNYNFKYEEHLNIIVDLTMDKDLLWKSLAKSRREGIRKARRNNLVFGVTNSEDIIPDFYNLLRKTYKHAKLPCPKIDFFYSLHNKLSSNNIKFFTLSKDHEILIAFVALIFNKCLSAFYIGTIRENYYLRMRPVDFFYWQVLCWGKENGCTTYDWLGAGKPDQEYGVRKFKLQYGGKVVELGRYEKVHRPFMMRLGKLGLKLWQQFR
jgi:lipid II:glycine glycyltransferase (peptidoglycan interpeptide bridge formation enzyme)